MKKKYLIKDFMQEVILDGNFYYVNPPIGPAIWTQHAGLATIFYTEKEAIKAMVNLQKETKSEYQIVTIYY